jgi:hypothetical protein
MDNLVIVGCSDKPEINFNHEKGTLYIGGSSLPENVMEVYDPVLKWIDKYMINPQPATHIEFFFEYLNTSSSHMIMRILEKVITLKDRCEELKISWYYSGSDPEMLHFGQELAELTNYPIIIAERDLEK